MDIEVNGACVTSSNAATSGGDSQQHLTIEVVSIDDQSLSGINFTIILDPTSLHPVQNIIYNPMPDMLDSKPPTHSISARPSLLDEDMSYNDEKHGFGQDDASFDFALEAAELHLLEEEAETLRVVIQTKKKAIAFHLREDRDRMSLQKLLDECDTLVCAARVIALRICDKVGVATDADLAYTKVQDPYSQRLIEIDDEKRPAKSSKAGVPTLSTAVSGNGGGQRMRLPAYVTKNETTVSMYSLQAIDLVNPSNPLVRALQMIAAVLGLTALCAYVRRRCMSVRKQVDRAADLEERRNARAYRRAARRAYMRKRWDRFTHAINCFGQPEGSRSSDYEEKRALILQDAFLEQLDDLEQAEKGQIMEAEIRELRHAREIVESLVQVGQHRFVVATPIRDPPPPVVPLPYTPATRSRASTHTLPSYRSESLPDYSSRPPSLGGSSYDSVVDGFTDYTPATCSEEEHASACSEDGRAPRGTPTSSVMNVSPRVSEDTLWTRQSRDTRGP